MELLTILKAISDESRLRILNLLIEGELCICKIETALEMTQSNVSRHLTKLKTAGILNSRKNAQWVYYSINHDLIESHPFLKNILTCELNKNDLFKSDIAKLRVLNNCNR